MSAIWNNDLVGRLPGREEYTDRQPSEGSDTMEYTDVHTGWISPEATSEGWNDMCELDDSICEFDQSPERDDTEIIRWKLDVPREGAISPDNISLQNAQPTGKYGNLDGRLMYEQEPCSNDTYAEYSAYCNHRKYALYNKYDPKNKDLQISQ